jgi:serine/threonine protein kinase
VDVDLVDGDVMEKLYNWSDDRKNQVLNTSPIEDPLVKRLICRLLSKQPFARGTMDDLLNDPFFDKKSNEQMAIKIDAGFNEIDARVIIEPEVPKVDHPPSAIEDETTSEAPKKKESVEHQQIIRNQSPVSSIYLNEDEEGDIDKNQFDANERTTR